MGKGVHERDFQTYFQILARKSPLPVAKSLPIGLGATEITVSSRCQQ